MALDLLYDQPPLGKKRLLGKGGMPAETFCTKAVLDVTSVLLEVSDITHVVVSVSLGLELIELSESQL
jgi:hypothetical protein